MPFLNDAFVDTDETPLAGHDPDIGDIGSWEALDFGVVAAVPGSVALIRNNRLETESSSAEGATHRNNTEPNADEYDISVTMRFRDPAQFQRFHWVTFCMSPTGTASADVDRYVLFANNATDPGTWTLRKIVSGVDTVLDTDTSTIVGETIEVLIEVRDDGMAVFLDGSGTPIVSSTDTELARPGRVGIGTARGDSSHWMDDLSAIAFEENVEQILASFDLSAHDAAVTRTGSADSESATFTVAAQDATALTGGAPQPDEAPFTVTAQDATVQTSEDNISALADAALVSMEAPFEPGSTTGVELVADNPIFIEFDAQDATINTSQATTANTALLSMFASDATVVSTGEQVFAQAQEATLSLVAHDSTPTGGANVSAEAATITLAAENTAGQANAELASFGMTARNAQVAIDAGDIVSPDAAEFTVSALGATTTITGEFVTVGAQTATLTLEALDATVSSVILPKATYRFFPPTIEENLTYDDPFLQRLYWERGVSVVKKGGQFITVRYVVPESLDGQTEGVYYFVGGHHYSGIPEAIALELIDAGYEPELEVVA